MNAVYPRVTPDRLRFMRELDAMKVGEPYVRGTTRNHLLKLGWTEGVLRLADGRQMSKSMIDATFGKGSEEWRTASFIGVTLTDAGHSELAKALQQTPGA